MSILYSFFANKSSNEHLCICADNKKGPHLWGPIKAACFYRLEVKPYEKERGLFIGCRFYSIIDQIIIAPVESVIHSMH